MVSQRHGSSVHLKGRPTLLQHASEYPTFVGPQSPAPEINIYNPETDQFEQITGPVGFDFINDFAWVAVPVAMPQFGIGSDQKHGSEIPFSAKSGF